MHNVYTHTNTQSTYNGLIVIAGERKKIMPVHSIDHYTGHGVTIVMILFQDKNSFLIKTLR